MSKQERIDSIFKKKTNNIQKTVSDTYTLKFDGCSKHNPGPSGAGAVIYKNNQELWRGSAFVGQKETNNVAEYVGLLIGLQEAIKKNINDLYVNGDSMLVIKQMRREYRVNSDNIKPYFKKARELEKQIRHVHYSHIYRSENGVADQLANEGLLLENS